ncbi:MAG TPA: ABC transporter permease [Vicinamibacterales bacterium]|nr:ABC transporter permease [Vicinamibacterales bacterium]
MSPMGQLWVVLRKEVTDAFRDRRAIMTIVLSAAISPLLLGFMMNRLADRQRLLDDVTIPVVGAEHAPAFTDWLRQQAGVTIVDGPADAEVAVRDRNEDVVLVIPEDFQEKFRSSTPAPIKIVSDGSRQTARPKVTRVRALLQRYNGEIGTLRLVSRGISPAIASPLQLEDVEVSSAQQRAAMILSFIPMFILLSAFAGGMQIAMDSTAGERERGSLEPLLVNPAPRHMIVGGKWLAATFTSALSVLLTTSIILAMLRFIPMQEFGVRFRLHPEQIGLLLVAALPMTLLASGVQTYLATFAKSFKEAQSYMGLLIILPMLPGFAATLYPMSGQAWMYPIPVIAQQVLAGDVVAARDTPWWAFVVAGGSALILSLVLLFLTTRLMQNERIIFTR